MAASDALQTTIDLRVDYHAPARIGILRGLGAILRLGRTVSSAEARILDGEGRLIASGRGRFMAVNVPLRREQP